jgi:serine/threonine protein kinase
MHGNRVLHRDLKTQNIFLLGNGRLVLGDLGISKVLDGTMDFAQTCIGTPYCKLSFKITVSAVSLLLKKKFDFYFIYRYESRNL